MSDKEVVLMLLEEVPDYKMGYLLAFIQGLLADEEMDDSSCQKTIEK